MQLNLSHEEREILLAALTAYHSEMRNEISNTDSYDLSASLKRIELAVVGVLEKLEPGWAARHAVQMPVVQQVPVPVDEYSDTVVG
jgi:hypothetical protein